MSLPSDPTSARGRASSAQGRLIGAAQAGRIVIRVLSAACLSRLLDPEVYGLYGMAAVVFGFLHMARDFGIVTALQHPGVTPATFRALCRAGLFGGLGLTGAGLLLAGPTGWFFQETERVPRVLMVMATSFVFAGLAAPAIGVLYREQRAAVTVALQLAGLAIASAAAIAAAWLGAGVWALVLFSVSYEVIVCGLVWIACPWRPGRIDPGVDWRQIFRSGVQLTGHQVATYARGVVDQLVVGRLHGVTALGWYGRGAQVTALPAQFGIDPFTPWVISTLGHLRGDRAEYVRYFRRVLNGLLHVSLAAGAACVAAPEVVVATLFGPGWSDAAPVARWLGLGLAVQPLLQVPIWLLGSGGQSRRLLYWSLGGLVVVATGCLLAAPHGPAAVALATAVALGLHAGTSTWICRTQPHLQPADWIGPLVTPLWLHGGMGGVAAGILHFLVSSSALPGQLAALMLGAAIYYALALLFSRTAWHELRHHLYWSR
jgi:O-antigen/teichoic acid export membrane protein